MSTQIVDSRHKHMPGGLDALLDDHAELRDIVAELREAADPDILSGLLHRLHGLLIEHFAREEADPSMQRVLVLPSSVSAESATRLIDEHRALLSALGDLVARAEESGERSAVVIARSASKRTMPARRGCSPRTSKLRPTFPPRSFGPERSK
jgi:hypothetical protein